MGYSFKQAQGFAPIGMLETGILEKWVLENCMDGFMANFVLTIILNGQHPFKNHYSIILQFHYSIIKVKIQFSNITLYYH